MGSTAARFVDNAHVGYIEGIVMQMTGDYREKVFKNGTGVTLPFKTILYVFTGKFNINELKAVGSDELLRKRANYKMTSNSKGYYQLALPPGEYTILLEANGVKSTGLESITIEAFKIKKYNILERSGVVC